MKEKPKTEPAPEEKNRRGVVTPPTQQQLDEFVSKIMNVPKSEIDKKSKLPTNRPRE